MSVLVEACVETLDEAIAAEKGGAHRLELCANMDVGGTTPSAELFNAVRSRVTLPIAMMIRPRGGSFHYTADELDAMHRDIDVALALGADAVVFGVLDGSGRVDEGKTRTLVARAAGTPVTFHKAFDDVHDLSGALRTLIRAGVSRVLTSGGAATAIEGVDRLATLVERAAGRITIMPGGTVRGHNVAEIVARTGVHEVHARCHENPARIRDIVDALAR
jgi:copper homeostasis protein